MNKSIVAILISVTLVVAAVAAACGQPAPAMSANEATTPKAPVGTVVAVVAVTAARATTDEERLDEMQREIQMVIAWYVGGGEPAPDHLYAFAQSIEEARRALRELEEERLAVQTYIGELTSAVCQLVPESEHAIIMNHHKALVSALESIEQARSEVLKAIGLER